MKHEVPALVLPLESVEEGDHAHVGGKAASLSVMAAAGFPVPAGVVLTTGALVLHLDQNNLSAELPRLGQLARQEGPLDEQELRRCGERVQGAPLPAAICAALRDALATGLGEHPLAVRSSGAQEDLAGASFAGLYRTVLGVRGQEAVEQAVRRCWASLWQPRVIDYLRRQGLGEGELGMSVVVQRMVDAEVAGVLFTVNPVARTDMELLVESVPGLGDALVSGQVNADRFLIDIRTGEVVSREIAAQAFKLVGGAAGVEQVPLPAAEAEAPSLSDAQLQQLVQVARDVQERYGRPMDVEFAFDRQQLWLVQARPITSFTYAPELGEWTTADFKDGGVSSDVCSRFMASLYEYAFNGSMPRYLKSIRLLEPDHEGTWCRMFFSRPYWNLGETKRVLEKVPGYSEASFDADLGIEAKPGAESRTTPTTLRLILGALPVLFALNRGYRERLAADQRYVEAFPSRIEPYDLEPGQIGALDHATLAQRYKELLEQVYFEAETSYFYTIYNTSNAKADLKPVFDKVNKVVGGDLDYLKLLSGLRDLSHVRVMKDMHRMIEQLLAEGRPLDDESVRAFARRWKHHSRKELDIRVPRWEDDLDHVRQFLQQSLADHDPLRDPAALEQAQRELYHAERARAERALRWHPFKRRSLIKKLERVRTYEWWREEMRDYSSYVYYLVRKWTVAAARRLVADGTLERDEEIWHLRSSHVVAALTGEADLQTTRDRVRWGRWVLRSFRNFDNPNEIGSRYRFDGLARAEVTGDRLQGIPCSAGLARGPAKVARTLEQAADVAPGSILVSTYTDPGWTPLFARIAGVVTETGGVLSHAAVISREYGIPAVLAVPGATAAIASGDEIAIDGASGVVEIVTRRR